jgi:hypothetical protein
MTHLLLYYSLCPKLDATYLSRLIYIYTTKGVDTGMPRQISAK